MKTFIYVALAASVTLTSCGEPTVFGPDHSQRKRDFIEETS